MTIRKCQQKNLKIVKKIEQLAKLISKFNTFFKNHCY